MVTRRFYFLISLITLLGMGQGHLKASNNEETITLNHHIEICRDERRARMLLSL